jgi:hypothetical protein
MCTIGYRSFRSVFLRSECRHCASERKDIPQLVRHFVNEFSRRNQRVIDTIPSERHAGAGPLSLAGQTIGRPF